MLQTGVRQGLCVFHCGSAMVVKPFGQGRGSLSMCCCTASALLVHYHPHTDSCLGRPWSQEPRCVRNMQLHLRCLPCVADRCKCTRAWPGVRDCWDCGGIHGSLMSHVYLHIELPHVSHMLGVACFGWQGCFPLGVSSALMLDPKTLHFSCGRGNGLGFLGLAQARRPCTRTLIPSCHVRSLFLEKASCVSMSAYS